MAGRSDILFRAAGFALGGPAGAAVAPQVGGLLPVEGGGSPAGGGGGGLPGLSNTTSATSGGTNRDLLSGGALNLSGLLAGWGISTDNRITTGGAQSSGGGAAGGSLPVAGGNLPGWLLALVGAAFLYLIFRK